MTGEALLAGSQPLQKISSEEIPARVLSQPQSSAPVRPSVGAAVGFVVPPEGTPKTGDYKPSSRTPGNEYDKFNTRLAYEVHRYVVAATGGHDRGVKRARFYVLKKASCPTILVESGFLSNADEHSQLTDPRYRHDIAEAIASGIVMYHRAVAGQ